VNFKPLGVGIGIFLLGGGLGALGAPPLRVPPVIVGLVLGAGL
jgi:hypothetical protein